VREALLVAHLEAHFSDLIRVARMLKQSAEYNPSFLFTTLYPHAVNDIRVCQAEGILCLNASGEVAQVTGQSPAALAPLAFPRAPRAVLRRRSRRPLVRFLRGPWRWCTTIWLPFYVLYRYRRSIRRARSLLTKRRPSILLLPEDNVYYAESIGALIEAGHQLGIPSVVIPYTIANELEPAETFYESPSQDASRGTFNRFISALYPQWVYEHRGRRLLRLPANQILGLEMAGLAPPRPWVLNSGYADAVAIGSEAVRRYYVRAGLPGEKLVVTGGLANDIMAEESLDAASTREELYRELRLPAGRPMILCALPPDQFPRPLCSFHNHDELVRSMVRALADIETHNLVVRPHPRVGKEELACVEESGAAISRRDTAQLIPLCDVFVASVSATIQWAIACGKPVVNYDVYRYRYNDYADVGGVVTVEEEEDFRAVLQLLTQCRGFYNEILQKQAECSPDWGSLDGRAGERLLHLIDGLVEGNDPRTIERSWTR
jgi:hypothetical protein